MDLNDEDQESSTSTVLSEATETMDDGDARSNRQEFPAFYLPAHEEANKVPHDLAMSAIKKQLFVKETNISPATKPVEPETVSEHSEDIEQEATELRVVSKGTAAPLEVLMAQLDLTAPTNPVTLPESHFEDVLQAKTKLQHDMSEDISVLLEDPIILTEFLERIQYSLVQIKSTLKQNYLSVEKMLDEILETEAKTLQEITSNKAILKSNLHSVVHSKVRTISNTLEHLETCFREITEQHLHGVSPKPSDLSQEGLGAERSVSCDPHLVTVSHVIDPGKFYVIRMCDSNISNAIVSTLKETASTYPVPEKIVPGKMYAVVNTGLNWYRGVCGKVCEQSQVDDKPDEIVYHFFLPDQGHHEHIPASSVRVLPFGLLKFPPTALQCKLNHKFDHLSWSAESVVSFKQMVRRSPMNMKVFKQEGGILEVDLAQLSCFGEESNISSVRDALFFSCRPPCNELTQKFKPKYGSHNLGLRQQVAKEFFVRVCWARSPINIYVHVLDEELLRFQRVHQEIQNEFNSAKVESVPQPQKGFAYAVRKNRQWYRVLAEDIFAEKNKLSVFYVDTGFRQHVNNYECFKLPERFMEMPAQAVRCVLDGVHPLSKGSSQWNKSNRAPAWPREVRKILYSYNEKKAVVFLEKLMSGEVGIGSANELTLWVVMYIDGERSSVNYELSRFNLTHSSEQHERPDHSATRMGLVSKYQSSSSNALRTTNSILSTKPIERDSSFDDDEPAYPRKKKIASCYDQSSDVAANYLAVRIIDDEVPQQTTSTNHVPLENVSAASQVSSAFYDPCKNKYTHKGVSLPNSSKKGYLSDTLLEPPEEMSSMTKFFALADVVPSVPVDSPIFYRGVKTKNKSPSVRARDAKRMKNFFELKKQ